MSIFARSTHCPGSNARAHAGEQIEILLHGSVAPGALPARLRECAPVFADFFRGEVVHIGQPLADEHHRIFIDAFGIVGTVEQAVSPIEAKPVDVFHDGVHEFHILLGGVRVVETQVAQAAIFFRCAEIDDERLGVPNVQIAVGFRREAGVDLLNAATGQIGLDHFLDEILLTAFHFFHDAFPPVRFRSVRPSGADRPKSV
jgi:hypothetical protein